MTLDPYIDRKRASLAEPSRRVLLADERRILVVGARGWIGRTVLDLLHEALGSEVFGARVLCFGTANGEIALDGFVVPQLALTELADLGRQPSLLFHLAFLTKDKIAGMDSQAYEATNRALSRKVAEALDAIGVDRLFVASSGAAAFAEDTAAAADLRLYGRLKREDEDRFAAWAEKAPAARRVAIGRIYSVSGPWINKHATYALTNFILAALSDRTIEVEARQPVFRSFVAVRELVSLVIASLLADEGEPVLRFDTGGEPIELGEMANRVGRVLSAQVQRRTFAQPGENRYLGDTEGWQSLIGKFGIDHLPIEGQIAETAAWLVRHRNSYGCRLAKD